MLWLIEIMNKTLQRDVYNLLHSDGFINKVKHSDSDSLTSIQYTCVYWVDHLCKIKSSHDEVSLYNNNMINVFLRKHFLHWLEALSLIKDISDSVLTIVKLIDLLMISCYLIKVVYLWILIDLKDFIWILTFSSDSRCTSIYFI